MIKKSQKGIAALETVLILVIVALIGFVAWYAFHTKNTTDNTYNNAANTQLAPAPKKTNTSSNTSSQVIQTKTSSKAGQYLADSKGMALYTYGADTTGVSNCSGSCLASWPAYEATDTSTSLPANVTIITRSDGTKQYAYKGMPLYTFTGDTATGQVTGDNVSNFHVAKP